MAPGPDAFRSKEDVQGGVAGGQPGGDPSGCKTGIGAAPGRGVPRRGLAPGLLSRPWVGGIRLAWPRGGQVCASGLRFRASEDL